MSLLQFPYELARHLRAGPADGFCESESRYRDHEDMFARKYRHWRGRSGRSYVFSVYAPTDCPAYMDTVLIVTARRGDGQVLACVDLGPYPDSWLFKLRRRFRERLDELEFHIHVLTDRESDRRALMADVAPLAA